MRPQVRVEAPGDGARPAARSLVLFGILVVNAPLYFWSAQSIPRGGIPALAFFDEAANPLVGFPFEGKFFTIFSLLFGIGVALQLSRGHRSRIVVRLLLLALFGAVHVSLFWWGDILLHDALLGFTLVLTRSWSARRLVRASFVMLAVDRVPSARCAHGHRTGMMSGTWEASRIESRSGRSRPRRCAP